MNILKTYRKMTAYPFGRQIFNISIGLAAPFFGKIKPNIIELKPGLCVIEIEDRWSIRNHIGTVNAGAMCTLVELAGGLSVDAAIQNSLRWLPKKMSVSYLKKGKGTLKVRSEFEPSLIKLGDIVIPLEIKDVDDDTVLVAEITFYISKKKT